MIFVNDCSLNSLKLVLQNDYVAQCCGSGMFIPDTRIPDSNFSIPDPRSGILGLNYSGSRIPDPKSRIWICINKLFLSSRKYDQKCSSRIRILISHPSPIPNPVSRGQKGTGSRIRNTDFANTFTSCISTTKVAKILAYIKIR